MSNNLELGFTCKSTPRCKGDNSLLRSSDLIQSYAADDSCNISNGEKMEKLFNGKKLAKLGTKKNPAVVNVQTKKRMKEVASTFEKKAGNIQLH